LGLGLLAAFMAAYISNPYPVEFLRLKTFDYFQKLRPRDIPPPEKQPVTIIDLDEDSLAEIGQWPWSRNTVAKLTENLFQMGAAQVAFDIVFAEPDRMNPTDIANSLAGLDDPTREKLRSLPGNDDAFARVIKKSGRVVLGYAGYWEKRESKAGPPVRKSISIRKRKGAREPKDLLPGFHSLVRNIPVLEKAAAGHGIFSLVPESDGIVRRVPTLFVFEGNIYTALAVEMMRVVFQRRSIVVDVDQAGVRSIGIAPRRAFPPKGLKISTDKMGRVWPYFSKHDKSKYVSARDVLAGTADPAKIKGKMTIVGTSAVGLLDIRATPVDAVIPGVEVHVQLIEAAL
jgi:adenylate cyclase